MIKLNRRITGTLAWGGLALILGVPSAELLSSRVDGGQTIAPAIANDPVVTGSVAKPKPDSKADPVDGFLQSGKPLPAYISDGAQKPRVVQATTPPQTGKPKAVPVGKPSPAVETAALAPQATVVPVRVAPVPMPASMRPRSVPVAALQQDALILNEDRVLSRDTALRTGPVPPASIPDVVDEDDLADWETGTLADYLAQRGLLDDGGQRRSSVNYTPDYDPDGFYLSDGPNSERRNRRDSVVYFSRN